MRSTGSPAAFMHFVQAVKALMSLCSLLRSLLESGQTPVAEQLLMAGKPPLACTTQQRN